MDLVARVKKKYTIHTNSVSQKHQISKLSSFSGTRDCFPLLALSLLGFWFVQFDEMRVLSEIAESPFVISRLSPDSTATGGFIGGWVGKCHGFLHNTVLVLASILFVAYLAYEAKKSLSKLSNRRSYIMIAYYGFLWLVSLLNLAWCCLQVC